MRTILLRSIGVISIGAGLILACSSASNVDDTTADASVPETGTIVTPGTDADTSTDTGTDATVQVACKVNTDCTSGVCNQGTGVCSPPTCTDGVKNQTETDIDCGSTCTKCDDAKKCALATDCKSGVCTGGTCAVPTNTDGVKNGNETGVDCGGTGNPTCDDGQACKTRDDCTNLYCKNLVCAPVTPADGVQDGTETDVDCGGVGNAPCADGLMCLADTDCNSMVCLDAGDGNGLRCQVPSTTDGKKNGTETDVDCGGGSGATCDFLKNCTTGSDCTSGGCNYQNTCAHAKSCAVHYGGDTCGTGGAGGVGVQSWEDCCATIPVTTTVGSGANAVTTTMYVDKYQTTAGRMRAFLESIDYDVRGFVQQARADGKIPVIPSTNNINGTTKDMVNPVLRDTWDAWLPTSFDGNSDGGEIADCDQGYWDYTNKTCCQSSGAEKSPAATSQALCDSYYGAGKTVFVSGDTTTEGGKCHYFQGGACPAGRTGISNGTYTAAKRHIGGTIFRANPQTDTGCFPGSPGTHSYRFPDGVHDPNNSLNAAYSQDVYDTKTINCVDYLVAQAFCVWDGGRAESFGEWLAISNWASGPADGNRWPWTPAGDARKAKGQISATFEGCRFPTMTDANQGTCPASSGLRFDTGVYSIELADYLYSYEYPTNLIGNDYIVFLTPPGRTTGRGPLGHADVAAAGFEHTSSVSGGATADVLGPAGIVSGTPSERWSSNGSWEVHHWPYGGVTGPLINKYGKLGVRCAKFAPN